MAIGAEGNVKWVDGFRGLASIIVVLTHLCHAWERDAFVPAPGENAKPRWFEIPVIRIGFQGRVGVMIFGFVTGYVCALKPIKLCRQGNQEAAFTAIAKSALRRFPRLFLPAAISTAIQWLALEMGLYTVASHTESWWLQDITGKRAPGNPLLTVWNMFYEVIRTWTRRSNLYDPNQWTMLPLLQESGMIYIFVIAAAYLKPRYRMLASLGMCTYYWAAGESTFGVTGFFGVLLAELQQAPQTALFLNNYPVPILSTFLCILGLLVASYPGDKPEWAAWSRIETVLLTPILPRDPDIPRFASSIGVNLVALGVVLNPWLQRVLSSRYLLLLGKLSFAVYLLHGLMIKTVLTWMVYGLWVPPDHKNDKGEMEITRLKYPGHRRLIPWMIVWLPMLYGTAYLWTTYVDPWCERMTTKLVNYVKLDSEKQSNGYLPMAPSQPA